MINLLTFAVAFICLVTGFSTDNIHETLLGCTLLITLSIDCKNEER